MKSASAILIFLSREDLYDPLASHPWRQSDAVSTPKWSCLWPVRHGCLGIRPHGIGGALAKTRAHPTGQSSSNRHNGALLAPGRRDPVAHLFEHCVARKRAPGGFDESGANTTGALAAHMAAPHGGPRRMRTRCQARVAEQRSLIGKACHVTQLGR